MRRRRGLKATIAFASCRRYCFQKHSCGSFSDRNSAATAAEGGRGAAGWAGGQAGGRATHSRPETIARPQQAEIPARAGSLAPSISPPLLLCCGGFPPISSSPAADAASSSSSSPSSPKNRLRHFFFPPRPRRSSPRPPQPPPNLGCFQPSDSASSTPPSVGRFSSSSLRSFLSSIHPSTHLPLLFQVRPSVQSTAN